MPNISDPATSAFLTIAAELDYGTSIHQSPDVLRLQRAARAAAEHLRAAHKCLTAISTATSLNAAQQMALETLKGSQP